MSVYKSNKSKFTYFCLLGRPKEKLKLFGFIKHTCCTTKKKKKKLLKNYVFRGY